MNEHPTVVPSSRRAVVLLSCVCSVSGCTWYGGDSPHLAEMCVGVLTRHCRIETTDAWLVGRDGHRPAWWRLSDPWCQRISVNRRGWWKRSTFMLQVRRRIGMD